MEERGQQSRLTLVCVHAPSNTAQFFGSAQMKPYSWSVEQIHTMTRHFTEIYQSSLALVPCPTQLSLSLLRELENEAIVKQFLSTGQNH